MRLSTQKKPFLFEREDVRSLSKLFHLVDLAMHGNGVMVIGNGSGTWYIVIY